MASPKILTKVQKKLAIDYLVSESKGDYTKDSMEHFFSSMTAEERFRVYLTAKKRIRAKTKSKVHVKTVRKEPQHHNPKPLQDSVSSTNAHVPTSAEEPLSPSGEAHKPKNKKPFLVHLSDEQISALKAISERTGESRAFHVRAALSSYIKTYIGDSNDDS